MIRFRLLRNAIQPWAVDSRPPSRHVDHEALHPSALPSQTIVVLKTLAGIVVERLRPGGLSRMFSACLSRARSPNLAPRLRLSALTEARQPDLCYARRGLVTGSSRVDP